jgi:hypothetical protein
MKFLASITLLLCSFTPVKKDLTSTTLLQQMYNRYHNKWHSTLQFTQTTERYRNDSLVKTDTWYEHIVYPDLLRIDFGTPKSNIGIIFRKDSTYSFRNNKIVRADKGENELIFFLGGMYFKTFEEVLAHFKELDYDLNKFHADTWKGKPVYVIGADKDGEKVNQLWIDKEKMVAVRFIKYQKDGIKEEGLFEDHVALKNAWSETNCTFYINGHILQVEKYRDIIAGGVIDKNIFDPAQFQKP